MLCGSSGGAGVRTSSWEVGYFWLRRTHWRVSISLRNWREWVSARNFLRRSRERIQLDSSPFFSRPARLFALAFGCSPVWARAGTHSRRLRRLCFNFQNKKNWGIRLIYKSTVHRYLIFTGSFLLLSVCIFFWICFIIVTVVRRWHRSMVIFVSVDFKINWNFFRY